MSSLKNKIDFAVVIAVKNANPNGDPLNGNRPRENYDGYGEISDVCIKRKIRNRLQDMGNDIFVQSNDRKSDNFKSLKCYEANLKSIAAEAESQQTRLVYLTFAWYLPADYSLQKFQAKTLDYTFCDHSRETEIWGLARNVGRFIDSVNHNSRSWLSQYPHAHWTDMQAAIPKEGKSFADVCHFSPVGIHQFAGVTCKELDTLLAMKAH